MDPEWRQLFDEQVELVLAELPQQVHDFMRGCADDRRGLSIPRSDAKDANSASGALVRPLHGHSAHQAQHRATGVFRPTSSISTAWVLLSKSRTRDGGFDEEKLREQIRRTILHEYGHHVGLTERDLRERGYG